MKCRFARFSRLAILSPDGLTAELPLRDRNGSVVAYAVVDAPDSAWASQWAWCLNSHGHVRRRDTDTGRMILLHRELLGLPRVYDGLEGDHKDRDPLNNRRGNLRIVPHIGNQQNTPSRRGSKSEHRGVSWDSHRGKWHARVQAANKTHYCGRFDTEAEAAVAARAGREKFMAYALD